VSEAECTCNKEEIEPHTCPYKEDVLDDYEYLCKCCDHCTHECALEI
jgi:hypothetical protein